MNLEAIIARLGGIRGIGGGNLMPMDEAEILRIEQELGVRLPEAYRQFLLTYGGCEFAGASPDNPFIVFRPLTPLHPRFKSGYGPFDAFYGKERERRDKRRDLYSLRQCIHFYKGLMPETIIPIGDDGIAGQICLGIKGKERGKVYYWDRENAPLDEEDYLEEYGRPRPPEALFENVYLIAESFEDFLQRLEIDTIEE
jgi:hypothetical protein